MGNAPFDNKRGHATYSLGMFIQAWAVLEAYLEYAIAQELGLGPLEGSIMTSGMQFKARAQTLQTLLNRNAVKNAAAIKELKALVARSDRNDVIHSIVGENEDGLVFTKRSSHGVFKSVEKAHDRISLARLTIEITEATERMKTGMGLTDAGFSNYFAIAHKAANSAGKSP